MTSSSRIAQRYRKAKYRDEPWKDKGYVAWLLWGGDPGKSWAAKVLKQMEAAESD